MSVGVFGIDWNKHVTISPIAIGIGIETLLLNSKDLNPEQDNCLENTVLLRHKHLSKFETSFNFLADYKSLLSKTILSNTKRKLSVLTSFSSSSLLACRCHAANTFNRGLGPV